MAGIEPLLSKGAGGARLAESLTNIAQTHAPDEVYAETRQHFSEKEVADLSIAIAMINAWNRLAVGSRTVHPADLAKAA